MCLLSTPRSGKWWESSFSFQSAYFVQDQSRSFLFLIRYPYCIYMLYAQQWVSQGPRISCQLYLSFLCYMYIHPHLQGQHSIGHISMTCGHFSVHRVSVSEIVFMFFCSKPHPAISTFLRYFISWNEVQKRSVKVIRPLLPCWFCVSSMITPVATLDFIDALSHGLCPKIHLYYNYRQLLVQ